MLHCSIQTGALSKPLLDRVLHRSVRAYRDTMGQLAPARLDDRRRAAKPARYLGIAENDLPRGVAHRIGLPARMASAHFEFEGSL